MPQRSAGILLYRLTAAAPEVLLVHPGGPFWVEACHTGRDWTSLKLLACRLLAQNGDNFDKLVLGAQVARRKQSDDCGDGDGN
jgi:hypothetical protein